MLENVEVCPISTLGEMCYLFPRSIIGDKLILSNIEFEDEEGVYHIEDIITDPQNPYII